MTDLEWGPIPPRSFGHAGRKIDQAVEQLKAHPGRTARVSTARTSTSAIEPWKERGCVAVVRGNKDHPGTWDVWAYWPEGKELTK